MVVGAEGLLRAVVRQARCRAARVGGELAQQPEAQAAVEQRLVVADRNRVVDGLRGIELSSRLLLSTT